MVWLAVAVAVLAVLHRRFRFAHPDGGGRQRKVGRASVEAELEWVGPVEVPRIAGSFGVRTTARQTFAVVRGSLAELVASRWFIVVMLACMGLTMLWGWNAAQTVFDTSTWPVTLLVAGTVLSQRAAPLIWVLIALYAGELVWKEREVGVAEITDAAPVPEGVVLLGRFLALVALLLMMQAASMVGGILIQVLQGYYDLELGLYLRIVFGLNLADHVLLAALAMTIHVVANHKGLGHMVVVLAILFLRGIARALGVQHHLLLYGTDPGWTYSDMNGFGPFIGPFVWFKLYWAAWALVLGVVAAVFWVRGREPGGRHRLRQARARFIGPVARLAGVAIVLILTLGGFTFYNTNVLNTYLRLDEVGAPLAEYEKRYGRYQDVAQPTITDVELRVEIYSDAPAVDLAGTYRLVNRTGEAIDSVHVSRVSPPVHVREPKNPEPASNVVAVTPGAVRFPAVVTDPAVTVWVTDAVSASSDCVTSTWFARTSPVNSAPPVNVSPAGTLKLPVTVKAVPTASSPSILKFPVTSSSFETLSSSASNTRTARRSLPPMSNDVCITPLPGQAA